MSNKANIERLQIDRYAISTSMVTSWVQKQLGFPIGADFTRWTGATGNHSYVRMRVGIANKDIVAAQSTPHGFVDRVLQSNAAGTNFKSNVTSVLKKFMYPEDFGPIITNPEILAEMAKYGLYDDRLREVMKFSQLAYVQEQKMWRLFLRPEKIIEDMLSDEGTGNVIGNFKITGVFGTTSDTISWEVEINREMMANTELGVVSIDRLFSY